MRKQRDSRMRADTSEDNRITGTGKEEENPNTSSPARSQPHIEKSEKLFQEAPGRRKKNKEDPLKVLKRGIKTENWKCFLDTKPFAKAFLLNGFDCFWISTPFLSFFSFFFSFFTFLSFSFSVSLSTFLVCFRNTFLTLFLRALYTIFIFFIFLKNCFSSKRV